MLFLLSFPALTRLCVCLCLNRLWAATGVFLLQRHVGICSTICLFERETLGTQDLNEGGGGKHTNWPRTCSFKLFLQSLKCYDHLYTKFEGFFFFIYAEVGVCFRAKDNEQEAGWFLDSRNIWALCLRVDGQGFVVGMGGAHTVPLKHWLTVLSLVLSFSVLHTHTHTHPPPTHTHTAVTVDSSKAGSPYDQNRQYRISDTNTEWELSPHCKGIIFSIE